MISSCRYPRIVGNPSVVLVFLLSVWPSGVIAETADAVRPPVTAMAFDATGDSLLVGSQAGLRVFDWPQRQLKKTLTVRLPTIHCLTFSPSHDRLAVGGGSPADFGGIEIFSWPDGDSIDRSDRHDDTVTDIVWLEKDTFVSASLDHSLLRRDLRNEGTFDPWVGHSRGVTSLCNLNDDKILVSGGIDQNLRVWNSVSGELLRSLNNHTQPVHALATRPNVGGLPMIASAGEDRTIRFWQPTIGRLVRFARLESTPLCIAWTTDGSRIVAGCRDGKVRLIDPDTAELTGTLPGIEDWAYAVAVHPHDGTVAVAGQNGQISRVKLP